MEKRSSVWELAALEDRGHNLWELFHPLISGAAAGSPSVSTADSAEFFLPPVSLSLGGGRQHCHGLVLSQGIPHQVCRGTARQGGESTTGQCVISSDPQSAPFIGTGGYFWCTSSLCVGIWAREPENTRFSGRKEELLVLRKSQWQKIYGVCFFLFKEQISK